MKWTFSIFLILTVLLIGSSFFRWSDIETTEVLPNATLYYKKDNWTGQAWVAHCGGVGLCSKLTETPLVTEEDRHSSYSHVMQDHDKHARSGFQIEAWRERDLVTYIWINLTAIGFIGTIISFFFLIKRKFAFKQRKE